METGQRIVPRGGRPPSRADVHALATADWAIRSGPTSRHVPAASRAGHRAAVNVKSLACARCAPVAPTGDGCCSGLRHGLRPPRQVREAASGLVALVLRGAERGGERAVAESPGCCGLAVGRGMRAAGGGCAGGLRERYKTPAPWRCSMPALTHARHHCVDAIPGPNRTCRRPIGLAERGSAPRPIAVQSSPQTAGRTAALNQPPFHYRMCRCATFAGMDPALAGRPNWPPAKAPRIGFVGAISAYKLD